MDRGGSFTEGELPDDTGDGPEEGDLPLRGWVPPDDRLWLHPSEIAKRSAAPEDERQPAAAAVGASRRPPAFVVAATLAAAVVLVALVSQRLPGQARPGLAPPGTTSLTTAVAPAPQVAAVTPPVAAVTSRLSRSLVGLAVSRSGRRSVTTGTVMAPGNLVVTAASAVAGATRMTAFTTTGHRLAAQVLGTDTTTGVAVLRVPARLAPANFTTQVAAGQLAMTDCLCGPGVAEGHPSAAVTLARVDAVGVHPGGPHHLLDGIEADHVRGAAWGSVLADSHGRVAGILDTRTTNHGTTLDVFVPGWLAQAVAKQLAADHRVVHGWLGVTGKGLTGSCGALVGSVVPNAAAGQALRPGEVVLAVNGQPVCDWAELRAVLYVVPPGQPVSLQVQGPSGNKTVAVSLSSSPG